MGAMFVLSEVRQVVRLMPRSLDGSLQDQVAEEINRKVANKVVVGLGLCLALYDITDIGKSFVFPGDSATHTKVTFRLLVFRPEQDEVITGKIKSCSRDGVTVSLGFFDDILIHADALQHPSRYDEAESVWGWEYLPEGEEETHDLFMDPGEQIRFRVTGEYLWTRGPRRLLPLRLRRRRGGPRPTVLWDPAVNLGLAFYPGGASKKEFFSRLSVIHPLPVPLFFC